MKKRRRKLKKGVYVFLIGIIIFIIILTSIINRIKLVNSNTYKLEKLGYNEEQIEIIEKLNDKNIKDILTKKFDKNIPKFAKQKYFMYKNLDRYLKYYKEHKEDKLSHIISIVNVHADSEWYDEDAIKKSDQSKGKLLLVNKFNQLDEKYAPKNLIAISTTYAYGNNNSASEEAFKAYKNMKYDATKEDLSLIITSSYRDFSTQDELWNDYAYTYSEKYADSISARAGFSEHQSGYAFDIVNYSSDLGNFEETDEFKWLQKNAYKYGFILRYPKDKEDITGYDYESWHYRYVGKDVAKAIKEKNITFDEYYAYYIEGDK